MSQTINLEEAQSRLIELVGGLGSGDEIMILQDQQPVAKLVGQRSTAQKGRVPGNCKGLITLAIDDDDHLQDFAGYMP